MTVESDDTTIAHPPVGTTVPGRFAGAMAGGTAGLILVQAGWIFAGMDYTIYSSALPLILADLHISIPTGGLIFFLSLQGTWIGSLLVPVIADYFGRRRAMMGNILLYALTTGAVAFAASSAYLTVARFLVNFGIGAEQPIGATYIAERWNPRTRARAMGFMQSGFAVGLLIASLLLATVAPRYGWRPLFLVGAIPALLVVGFRFWLPESEKWKEHQEQKRRAQASEAERSSGFTMGQLFTPTLRRATLVGTVLLLAGNTAGGGILAWAPTYLKVARGLDIGAVGWLGVVQALGLLVGYNMSGVLSDWTSRRISLMVAFGLGIVSLIAFGLVTNLALVAIALFLVGTALGGQFGNFITYLSELFPTAARATGVGWCMGIGLVAWSIVPLVLGLLAPTGNFGTLFAILGGAACLIGIITAFLGPETKDRPLE
jgi:putative MFS transporter